MLYGYRLISTKVRSIIVVSFDLHSLTGAGFGMVLTSIAPDGTGAICSGRHGCDFLPKVPKWGKKSNNTEKLFEKNTKNI